MNIKPVYQSAGIRQRIIPLLLIAVAWIFLFENSLHRLHAQGPKRIAISVQHYDPTLPKPDALNMMCFRLMQEDPELEILPYIGMRSESGPESAYFMSVAADIAPDVTTFIGFPHCRNFSRQGFFLPLNEFIGTDRNGDGVISDDEAIWPEWKNMPEYFRRVATLDGKIYALPQPNLAMGALLFRKDLMRQAGVNPDTPPADWDEFYRVLQKLTNPHRQVPGAPVQMGQTAIALYPWGWTFSPWVWAAGGDLLKQSRTNPRTGKTYWYSQEELEFRDPETGESLLREPPNWQATFAHEPGLQALEFNRKLRFGKWLRDPATGEPVDLTDAEAAQGWKDRANGTRLNFSSADINQGVARVMGSTDTADRDDLFRRGEVAMIFWVCMPEYFQTLGIPPENLGFWPIPPRHAGLKPGMLAQYHFMGLNANLAGEANKAKRQKAWEVLSTLVGSRGAKWTAEFSVREGMGQFLQPELLQRAGLTRELELIPLSWRQGWAAALPYARTEPYEGSWAPVCGKIISQDVLSLTMTQEHFDWRSAFITGQQRANEGLMFKRNDAQMNRYRPWGWLGIAILALAFLLAMFLMTRMVLQGPTNQALRESTSNQFRLAWPPILLLAPAVCLILIWQYYPLARGAAMAFQDYIITGDSRWVGVDNFITVVLDANFWIYFRQTFKFVLFSLLLGFFTPVFLALLLSEVPRGKAFFRTLFFLPQISSGLVILFLWKVLIYNPTANGLLNRLIPGKPIDWLGDPHWAMAAVILPGVWAGAGIGSLVYLAALKGIPEDVYEAADLDGCSLWQKIWHVTIPSLLPLLIINFVGTFIGTFHAMGNIFAMTGGGPGNETMVMSLAIWYEAFSFLRFGSATAMAWMLGSLLVGFTLIQLRILRKVEFRKAAE